VIADIHLYRAPGPAIENRQSAIPSLGLFVRSMTPALPAKLFELEAIRCLLLVFRRRVVPVLALGALQRDVVSRHKILDPVGSTNFGLSSRSISVPLDSATN
jgi:hypothetical protein